MQNPKLISRALEAKQRSYSPYSNYQVGAALVSETGRIYVGTNVENRVNDLSICAERVALFSGIASGERKFSKIAIVGESEGYCYPCGACRQTLFEHSPELKIVLARDINDYITRSLSELLPEPFDL